jgi:uncharacterized DUF497 family protein
MDFEWDPEKAESNLRKHHVGLRMPLRCFLIRTESRFFDSRSAYGEDRWITVGLVEPALLVVVYAIRGEDGDIIRLVSARKADKDERTQYRETQA